jgi:hypothetical protein
MMRSGAVVVSLAAHLLHHLACFRSRFIAVKLDENKRGALNVEIGCGHDSTVGWGCVGGQAGS